jgi:hypothetical protein
MATDGWIEFDGRELINLSRTAQLAEVMGIDVLWTTPEETQWIEDALGGSDYANVATAPWYDPEYPASSEFAGIVPVSFSGLDDSSSESKVQEFIGDGGNSGRLRNGTIALPAKVYVIASTDRGAEYGKRWLDRMLRASRSVGNCSGYELRYFRYPSEDSPQAHRRDVKVSRGAQVIAKRSKSCSVSWVVIFTLTDADGYEYGDPVPMVDNLGGVPTGPVISSGNLTLTQQTCPDFDYSPISDPLFPALISPPSVPNFYPNGWDMPEGRGFKRLWVTVPGVEPSDLLTVPVITLVTSTDARMVRVSIWDSSIATISDQCDPLFSSVVTYLPAAIPGGAALQFVIDGEQKVCYLYDGVGEAVRRTDQLVYSGDASPIQWAAFDSLGGLMISLDLFARTQANGGGYEGSDNVRVSVALVPKSD